MDSNIQGKSQKQSLKQNQLNKIISKMSKNVCSTTDISLYGSELQEIYKDDFRHSYSTITGSILEEYNQQKNNVVFSNIMLNLQAIIEVFSDSVEPKDYEFVKKISKLHDHISLEYSRIELIFSEYESRVKIAEEKLAAATTLSEETLENADKLKTEVITILSIFAAIVLAFMGGMSFTASTFQNIADVSFYRIALIALLCGFVIFNTVSVLLYIVSKIINRSILIRCKSDKDCLCEKRCLIFNRIRKRLPFVFWVNVFLFLNMLAIFLGWLFDIYGFAEWVQSGTWYYK